MKTGEKQNQINSVRAHEVHTKATSSRAGQDSGKDRIPAGAQSAQGMDKGNQLAAAKSELVRQHPSSGGRGPMRGK